ncbi:hypothetical protein BCR43DRAFT_497957 [Syncephalastrum racemosum]|uniref:SET domain-containing protein n=1 Tax=Syncephalastrum racemosum TaxID=13706 RepID=A0A1X2H339_SYNRA|nr:hypothetical protein BCR43DRAFT_497957 [Syncephalastrum racemosum]
MDKGSPLEQYLRGCHLELQAAEESNRGRNVVATSLLKRGSVVTTSQPLGAVPLKANRHEFCNYCFRKLGQQYPPAALQRCSRCKAAYFCDMQCFKNAWLSYHQFVCQPPAANDTQDENNEDQEDQELDLEMTERVALNVARYEERRAAQPTVEEEVEDETVEVTMEAFSSLMEHREDHPKHLLAHYEQVARTALAKSYIKASAEDLIRYQCRFRCNNFAIYDEQLFTIGEGTYPVASLFNHTCRPNAAIIFDGALLVIKAIEDILPGQEVSIAYVDVAHARQPRLQSLQDKYFFTCTCPRCTDDSYLGRIDAMLGEEPSDWERAQELLDPSNSFQQQVLAASEDWDLLGHTRRFNRKNNDEPELDRPLTLSLYTHFCLQRLTPYLWTARNASFGFVSGSPPQTPPPSTNSCGTLTTFDDPPPSTCRPYPGETYEEILEGVITKAQQYPVPAVVPYRIRTLAAASRLFFDQMMESKWRNATRLGMYILVQYSIVYPPYHPMLAQHLLLLAKAAWNSIIQNEMVTQTKRLENVQERGVRRWIVLAKEVISCTFGRQSNMWREVVELEWIFMREQKLKS